MALQLLQEFRSDRSGASAVEFSLVAPLFVGLMMAICEFSFAFFTLTSAQQAVWTEARQLALGRITTTAAHDAVVAALPRWAQTKATVTAAKDPADATRYLVTAAIPLTSAAPTSFFASLYGTRSMTASATLPQESQ
ncbi:TadE/TadG family type IV pilus assembly protein [Methylobacterium sp. CM6257]|jgi:Flp pilus assembly protein TadG